MFYSIQHHISTPKANQQAFCYKLIQFLEGFVSCTACKFRIHASGKARGRIVLQVGDYPLASLFGSKRTNRHIFFTGKMNITELGSKRFGISKCNMMK